MLESAFKNARRWQLANQPPAFTMAVVLEAAVPVGWKTWLRTTLKMGWPYTSKAGCGSSSSFSLTTAWRGHLSHIDRQLGSKHRPSNRFHACFVLHGSFPKLTINPCFAKNGQSDCRTAHIFFGWIHCFCQTFSQTFSQNQRCWSGSCRNRMWICSLASWLKKNVGLKEGNLLKVKRYDCILLGKKKLYIWSPSFIKVRGMQTGAKQRADRAEFRNSCQTTNQKQQRWRFYVLIAFYSLNSQRAIVFLT